MLNEIIEGRGIPALRPREEMLEILLKEEYGYLPKKPDGMTFTVKNNHVPAFCAGKATCQKVTLTCSFADKSFSFPVYVTVPTAKGKHPFFVMINFRDDVPDRYMPSEEIVDRGFAVLSFCYQDVTKDDGDFTDGLAGVLYENGERGERDAGKIAMWAWAAHRVLDYAETLDALDTSRAYVCGHSRLGKTALLAGATDTRFKLAYSNDSGCCGAAISRGKVGESVEKIVEVFPQWFCKNYYKYSGRESEQPFDQHYLVACMAPRHVYVASASEDIWADPVSEMLSCVAASAAWEKEGLCGFRCEDRLPETGDVYHDGRVGYHLRAGLHYFSREDWNHLIDYVIKHNL